MAHDPLEPLRALADRMTPLLDRSPRGLREAELVRLERGGELPTVYRELVLWLGRDHGGLLGEARFGPAAAAVNESELRQVLAANDLHRLVPADAAICYGDEGYRYAWIEAGSGVADPPVTCLHLSESLTPANVMPGGPLSRFVFDEMRGHAAMLLECRRDRQREDRVAMVRVAAYADSVEAHLACNLLRNVGIAARLRDVHGVVYADTTTEPVPCIPLFVPDGDLAEARRLLHGEELA